MRKVKMLKNPLWMRKPVWMHNSFAIASLTLALSLTLYSTVQSQPTPITLSPQFSPNPTELRGTAGGTTPVTKVTGRADSPTGPCIGFANTTPNNTIVLKGEFNALRIQVESGEDTALVVKGPGGIWCNDDFQGKNPGVAGQWLPGKYEVWVSTYAKERTAPYVLRLSSGK
jgi:hypothetical protein